MQKFQCEGSHCPSFNPVRAEFTPDSKDEDQAELDTIRLRLLPRQTK